LVFSNWLAEDWTDAFDEAIATRGVKLEAVSGGRANRFIQLLPQSGSRPRKPYFYILVRSFEPPDGLFRSHSFYIAQDKKQPLLIGQGKHSLSSPTPSSRL